MSTPSIEEVDFPVPQRCKEVVVRNQYRGFWYILLGTLVSMNVLYYFLRVIFHWRWQLDLLDFIMPFIGLFVYIEEARKPWRYVINQHRMKIFRVSLRSGLAEMTELEWSKTEITGVSHEDWMGMPCLRLNAPANTRHKFVLSYDPLDEEEIKTRIVPLIEQYRKQYQHELWAGRLRS